MDKNLSSVYFVRGIRAALLHVVPHFETHPLKPEKQNDFLKYKWVVETMAQKKHLSLQGWKVTLQVALSMNKAGVRKRSQEDILAHYSMKNIQPLVDGVPYLTDGNDGVNLAGKLYLPTNLCIGCSAGRWGFYHCPTQKRKDKSCLCRGDEQ